MLPALRIVLFTLTLFACGLVGYAVEPENGGGEVKFYGISDSAKKIVYVLDHSGSMLDTFDFMRTEAIRSVNALTPEQSFGVVMFSERESVIYPKLQAATPEVKKDFATKMQMYRAQGMNDDLLDPSLKALEVAFKLQPEVIYFLTDGRFDPRLIDVVTKKLNKNKKIRVNTVAFVLNDAISEEQLKDLAKQNGGAYAFVAEQDLAQEKRDEVKFYGVADSAKKIVYVLDHGGSLLDVFDFLRKEAVRSVDALTPEQAFGVVMFTGEETVVYPELQKATPEQKRDFAAKMQNFRAQGIGDEKTDSGRKALEAAFKLQPEVIYFLTDNRLDPRTIDIVTKDLNKAKKVRVHTVAFVTNDAKTLEQLKDLAKQNGGRYKAVSEKDLWK
ncbi:MAG: VWA domain-containing protein [Phycisphaerales bacterium]|nr:VWA domain-containing protein [Phycisphaerales bacterium]